MKVKNHNIRALFAADTYNAEAHTVEVVAATETTEVKRYDWRKDKYFTEVLGCKPEEVRTDRLETGIQVLDSHKQREGLSALRGITVGYRIADNKVYLTVKFDQNTEEARTLEAQVRDGIAKHVSVGYHIYKYFTEAETETNDLPTYRATDWTPTEISFVTVPADAAAGVRNADDKTEAYEVTVEGEPKTEETPDTPAPNYDIQRRRLALRQTENEFKL